MTKIKRHIFCRGQPMRGVHHRDNSSMANALLRPAKFDQHVWVGGGASPDACANKREVWDEDSGAIDLFIDCIHDRWLASDTHCVTIDCNLSAVGDIQIRVPELPDRPLKRALNEISATPRCPVKLPGEEDGVSHSGNR